MDFLWKCLATTAHSTRPSSDDLQNSTSSNIRHPLLYMCNRGPVTSNVEAARPFVIWLQSIGVYIKCLHIRRILVLFSARIYRLFIHLKLLNVILQTHVHLFHTLTIKNVSNVLSF